MLICLFLHYSLYTISENNPKVQEQLTGDTHFYLKPITLRLKGHWDGAEGSNGRDCRDGEDLLHKVLISR